MTTNPSGLQAIPSGTIIFGGPMLGGNPLHVGEVVDNAFNPAVTGLARPVGSLIFSRDGTKSFVKTGSAATAWTTTVPPYTFDGSGNVTFAGKVGIGTAPSAELQVNLTNDTNPSLVNSWDSRHFVYGVGATSTAPGVGCSYQTSTSTVFLSALQPGVAWLNYTLQCQSFLVSITGTANAFQVTAGAVTVIQARLHQAKGTDLASATTLTLGSGTQGGNHYNITGTTTVQGIVTTGWNAGDRIVLQLASGITITHNSGAPGAGAVAIQLNAGANLVTARVTMLALIFNGTFWYQEG